MSRRATSHRNVFATLTLASFAAMWWGCSASGVSMTTTTTTSTGTGGSSSSSSGTGGELPFDGGGNDGETPDACVAKSEEAHRVPLDLFFLLDWSSGMQPVWKGATSALKTFFNDPASTGVSASLTYMPSLTNNTQAGPFNCNFDSYLVPDVPMAPLPGNAFDLTNSMPVQALGNCTPTYGALKGALKAATAYQDAHPTHKVHLVFATDGQPWSQFGDCAFHTIDDVADLAKGALSYNGVRTYVIAVNGGMTMQTYVDAVAKAGGTNAAYDVTTDVTQFAATIAEIRNHGLGCDYELPAPPQGEQLDPNAVNFTYTPKGVGAAKTLPRADNLADCGNNPGWYYDNNDGPTRIVLCPQSCNTVKADDKAKVDLLVGCKSVAN